jgi:hypothetical protein
VKLPRRFSLRLVLFLVTLFVVALSLRVKTCSRHERALEKLRGKEGIFIFGDFEDPIGPNWMWTSDGLGAGSLKRHGLGWLIGTPLCIVGYRHVWIDGALLSDDDWSMLADMRGVEYVGLDHVPLTADVVRGLIRLGDMRNLDISAENLDDDAVPLLAHLPRLDEFSLTLPFDSTAEVERLRDVVPASECHTHRLRQ